MEDLHFPGQDLPEHKSEVPEAPAPEAPKPEEDKAPDTPETPAQPEAPQPEAPKEPEASLPKKRSIYDDLKDTRQERNDWKETTISAIKALGFELKGDETPQQLQTILTERQHKPPEPPKPDEPAKPADPFEAFAKEKGYDPQELAQLRDLFLKDVPSSQLTAEERQTLKDLQEFKTKTDTEAKRRDEDATIMAEAPAVRTALSIHDDNELAAVMKEVTRLAHTERYADKEIDYILFKEKGALSKLVSPKKPSFESGDVVPPSEPEAEVDFSKGGVTPKMAQKATQPRSRSQLEHRKAQ